MKTAQHKLHLESDPPMTCEDCHERIAGEYLPAKSWRCVECHEDSSLVLHEAASAESEARACWSCHDFSSSDKAPTPCASCHSEAVGDLPAITPHDPDTPDEDCGTCHRAHESPSLVSAECESCHDDQEVSGHDKPDIQITGCGSCHGYHEEVETATERCTGCHRQSRADVPETATFEGHDDCVRCHQPHRFFKSEVVACADECHEVVHALAEHEVAEHRCLGCHDNHAVRESAPRSCQDCHRHGVVLEHPKDRASGTRCLGCHKPHAGPGAPMAVACTTCHDNARSDAELHQGSQGAGPTCRECHKQHAFDLADSGTSLCLGCHGDTPFANAATVQTHEEHSDCFRCHGESVAHAPGARRAECGSCHEEQADLVHEAHWDCAGCHEPHSTTLRSQCEHCHEDQADTAPLDHKQCRSCHQPHSTTLQTRCSDCHQERTTGIHADVEGGCQTCHRPHGPKGPASPPRCASCHNPEKLPVLHRVQEHRTCTNCHRSHGTQPFRRAAACLSCHTAQRDHEPRAKMCVGCHMFTEGG